MCRERVAIVKKSLKGNAYFDIVLDGVMILSCALPWPLIHDFLIKFSLVSLFKVILS